MPQKFRTLKITIAEQECNSSGSAVTPKAHTTTLESEVLTLQDANGMVNALLDTAKSLNLAESGQHEAELAAEKVKVPATTSA